MGSGPRRPRLESEIDGLYRLPAGEFTPARDALARRLKESGRREEAERVKSLGKPRVSAWVVNQLWWNARKPFTRLLEAGAVLREIQQDPEAGDLRAATERRRQAAAALRARAEAILADAGQSMSPALARRIDTNLEAIATHGDAGSGGPLGRLTADLEAPGFDALLAMAAGKKKTPAATARQRALGARERERALRVARAEKALARAEALLERRRSEAERAETDRRRAEERAADVRQQISLARRRLRLAEEHGRRAVRELERCGRKAEQTARAVAETGRAVKRAGQALKEARRK